MVMGIYMLIRMPRSCDAREPSMQAHSHFIVLWLAGKLNKA